MMTSNELINQEVMFKSLDMKKYRSFSSGIEGIPIAPGLRAGLFFGLTSVPPHSGGTPRLLRQGRSAAASPREKSGKDGTLSTVAKGKTSMP